MQENLLRPAGSNFSSDVSRMAALANGLLYSKGLIDIPNHTPGHSTPSSLRQGESSVWEQMIKEGLNHLSNPPSFGCRGRFNIGQGFPLPS